MEALGGIGYLENEESQHINVARLYRDANVLAIWEGTTNVLGTDFVKILKGRNGAKTLEALDRWVSHALTSNGDTFIAEKEKVAETFRTLKVNIQEVELDVLIIEARELMDAFAAIVSGALLIVDAERDDDPVSSELCRRYFAAHGLNRPQHSHWKSRSAWDSRIVFGKTSSSKAHL